MHRGPSARSPRPTRLLLPDRQNPRKLQTRQIQGGTVTRNEILFLLPVGLLLLGVLVCLVLEAAGTPVGARKRGVRIHLAMFTLFVSVAALVQLQVFRNVVQLDETIFNVILSDHLGYLGGGLALVLLIFTVFLAIPTLRVLQKRYRRNLRSFAARDDIKYRSGLRC